MADEAIITTLFGNQGDPIEYTIAAGSVIPKGSIMQLSSSPQTVTISSGDGQTFAGIAAFESTATDTFTKLTCITNCMATLSTTGGGSMTLGQSVKIIGLNFVLTQDETSIVKIGEHVGTAMDTVGATATGSVRVLKI